MAGSVVAQPNGFLPANGGTVGGSFEIPQLDGYSIVAQFAESADTIPQWGFQPGARDRALRAFWPNEPFFASALYDTIARYAAFGWTLEGGPRTVAAMQTILHTAEHGEGWIPLIHKVLIDLYTQDNGAFIEVVRADSTPNSPVVELNHLDSGRCVRTGFWDYPVIYYDIQGRGHRLASHQVVPLAEFPSSNENMRGVQYCALTRCLRAAQIMREIQVYNREKVSGRFTKRIFLVGGMSTRMIEDAVRQHQAAADAAGQLRFIQPVVLGTLDPTAQVSLATLDLANLPDNFNEEVFMHWYVTQLAMAFGSDYQDFAPLPGRAGAASSGAGAAAQQARTRGKGPQMFMRTLEQAFNFHGIMPRNVTFKFGEQDNAAALETILLGKEYALYLQVLVEAGIVTDQVARQMLSDKGFLDPMYLELMRDPDPTPDIVQPGSVPYVTPPAIQPGDPGPTTPPGGAGAPPTPLHANSNAIQTRPIQSQRPAIPAVPPH